MVVGLFLGGVNRDAGVTGKLLTLKSVGPLSGNQELTGGLVAGGLGRASEESWNLLGLF
jgi:hypothetical protein